MELNTKDLMDSIVKNISSIEHIKPKEIPDIELYMDQVTTLINSRLGTFRHFGNDKPLTKTMINNYAKNNLLPSPNRKKYSKDHILTLIFIYYFKNIVSINEIRKILDPVTKKFFGQKQDLQLEEIYQSVFSIKPDLQRALEHDIAEKLQLSQASVKKLKNIQSDDEEFLQAFTLICTLAIDIYMKKIIIEQLIDSVSDSFKK